MFLVVSRMEFWTFKRKDHTKLNKLICTWKTKSSLGFMHPQNQTAFSEPDTLLFTVALDPTSLPKALHHSYSFFSVVRKQTNCPQSECNLIWSTLTAYLPPSTVSAMLKVASKKTITIPRGQVIWRVLGRNQIKRLEFKIKIKKSHYMTREKEKGIKDCVVQRKCHTSL